MNSALSKTPSEFASAYANYASNFAMPSAFLAGSAASAISALTEACLSSD